tara:strand:- start:901 stop:1836 length:936 start_codon:yes stop_codon:yes gene_type:complete
MNPRKETLTFKQQLELIENFPAPQSPKGYKSFRDFFLKGILSSFQGENLELQRLMPYYNAILVHALREKAPTYFLTEEIKEAAENTNIPPVDSDEAPFKYLNVFTPDGLTAAVKVQSMSDIYRGREERYRWADTAERTGITFNAFDAQTTFSAVIFVEDKNFKGSFRQLFFDIVPPSGENKDALISTPWSFGYSNDFVEKEIFTDRSLQEMTRLIVNTVLLIKHQPALVTVEKSATQAIGFSQKPSNEPMPVRWLGKNFSNNRTKSSAVSGGSHASPRAHWRRGHWHGYRYGEGRKTLKRKWVQPVYVNPQ